MMKQMMMSLIMTGSYESNMMKLMQMNLLHCWMKYLMTTSLMMSLYYYEVEWEDKRMMSDSELGRR